MGEFWQVCTLAVGILFAGWVLFKLFLSLERDADTPTEQAEPSTPSLRELTQAYSIMMNARRATMCHYGPMHEMLSDKAIQAVLTAIIIKAGGKP